jgi:hypothetical protein
MKMLEGDLNPEVHNVLYQFSDWFFQQDRSLIHLNGEFDQDEYYTSQEYFDIVNKDTHEGYPEDVHGIDLGRSEDLPIEFYDKLRDLDKSLNAIFGSQFNAVKMYYPKGGFMGWHNNWNCPGYNILLSYTENGNGFFRYQDPVSKEIVTMDDIPGWSVKVGYYGEKSEADKVYWHCARAYEERLTLGYVIPNEYMWEMAIEDIVQAQ